MTVYILYKLNRRYKEHNVTHRQTLHTTNECNLTYASRYSVPTSIGEVTFF